MDIVEMPSTADPSLEDAPEDDEAAAVSGPVIQLDDGTGVCVVDFGEFYKKKKKQASEAPLRLEIGMYVLVLAIRDLDADDDLLLTGFVIKDLSSQPDRWTMWWCELIESHHCIHDLGSHTMATK